MRLLHFVNVFGACTFVTTKRLLLPKDNWKFQFVLSWWKSAL